jgi:hypothetical protein
MEHSGPAQGLFRACSRNIQGTFGECSLLWQGGKPSFFVKWAGYRDEENTWEPLENLEGCELLEDFLEADSKRRAQLEGWRRSKKRRTRKA